MTHEELELFTGIRDFTTVFYVILRQESFEWSEPSVGYENCNVMPFMILLSSNTLSIVRTGY